MVKVKVVHTGEVHELDFAGKVSGLAERFGLSLQETIFKVNGKIRPDNYCLKGDEEVEVVKVVFGG